MTKSTQTLYANRPKVHSSSSASASWVHLRLLSLNDWSCLAFLLKEEWRHYTKLKQMQVLSVIIVCCVSQKARRRKFWRFLPDQYFKNPSAFAKTLSNCCSSAGQLELSIWFLGGFFGSHHRSESAQRVSRKGHGLFCIFLGWFWNWSVTQKHRGQCGLALVRELAVVSWSRWAVPTRNVFEVVSSLKI